MTDLTVRPALPGDCDALAALADETLFPGEMLADMIAPFFGDAKDVWLVICGADGPCGFAFAQAEAMSETAWNLRAIAVSGPARRNGAARALMGAMEEALRTRAACVLVVDTASGDDQIAARALYRALGYTEAGRIPDFWGAREAKVTFYKGL